MMVSSKEAMEVINSKVMTWDMVSNKMILEVLTIHHNSKARVATQIMNNRLPLVNTHPTLVIYSLQINMLTVSPLQMMKKTMKMNLHS